MSCKNCNTCNVSEKRGCGTSSVFDWLYQIENPATNNKDLVEIQFKADRKGYYVNGNKVQFSVGDIVVAQGEKIGHDIGRVSMKGELVALQLKRKKITNTKSLRKIYRRATEQDLTIWEKAIDKESVVLKKAKEIIFKHNLDMKLSDVEFQADNKKATFYYIAEKRVDFRALIKSYSREFQVKIEMKQIGVRQEAAKIGGIGSCGRELCCSTWMTDFPTVTTSAVRYQQLAINPDKISGQCGRLKCCLNFELEAYTEELKQFPSIKRKLKFKKGDAKCFKLDVFKRTMQYYYLGSPSEIIEIHLKDVNKIIKLNEEGIVPEKMESYTLINEEKSENKNILNEGSLDRFDKKK